MQLQPTQYTATDNERWNFRIGRIKDDAWSIFRWPIGEVYIPPRTEVLTVDGWRPLLTNPEPRYLNNPEVAQLSTGALTLPE